MRLIKLPCINGYTFTSSPSDSKPILGECIIDPDKVSVILPIGEDQINVALGGRSITMPISAETFLDYCDKATNRLNDEVKPYAELWEGRFAE